MSTLDVDLEHDHESRRTAETLTVVVHLASAIDKGAEIDLDLARQMLQGELGQFPRRKRTPESIG
jgi:hypothetical protein